MFVTKIQMRLHKELYPKKNSFSLLKDYCIFVSAKIRGHDVSFEALKAVFLKKTVAIGNVIIPAGFTRLI